jgi:hypothetical protein
VSLLPFELQQLLSGLLATYFKKLPLFRECYEIAVLGPKEEKYERLAVEEPVIELSIPAPYHWQPLGESRFLGEPPCFNLEGLQD